MNLDVCSITLRFAILFLLTACSDLAVRTRQYCIAFFTFSMWLLFFRLTAYRSVATYIGLFHHERGFAQDIQVWLLSSSTTNWTDIVALLGIVGMFVCLRRSYKK